jgi:UDP-GlcNAc:undecaprenyl-phosphate GlcNAc-1-phosphate transferase
MLIFPVVACLVTALAIAAMLGMKHSLPLDRPNHRSLHEKPTPRTGGLAIMLGAGCGWALAWPPSGQIPMLVLAFCLSAFTFFDDLRGLSRSVRFLAQIAAAVALVWLSPPSPGSVISILAAVMALVWMSNLFNFMDGSDGLAGGMAAFGFGLYSVAALQGGMTAFAVTAACLTGASIGFLGFNFAPARIFMGDAGSVPLGFLAAALGLAGWQAGLWPIVFPILVFSPFIVDASVTLAQRLLRGDEFLQPHREHYYQRLIRMGWGHRNTALLEYGLMLACGLSALAIRQSHPTVQFGVVAGWALAYGGLKHSIDKAWKKHARECPSS